MAEAPAWGLGFQAKESRRSQLESHSLSMRNIRAVSLPCPHHCMHRGSGLFVLGYVEAVRWRLSGEVPSGHAIAISTARLLKAIAVLLLSPLPLDIPLYASPQQNPMSRSLALGLFFGLLKLVPSRGVDRVQQDTHPHSDGTCRGPSQGILRWEGRPWTAREEASEASLKPTWKKKIQTLVTPRHQAGIHHAAWSSDSEKTN